MTLVETLLAVAISVLVLGLVYSVYHTTMTVIHGQTERRGGESAAMEALSVLSRDIACTFPELGSEGCPFTLTRAESVQLPGSELSFCTAVPQPDDDLEWFSMQQLVIHVVEDADGHHALVREHLDLVGPGSQLPPVTNVLVTGVADFYAEVFYGDAWVDSWPIEESIVWPEAVRLRITLDKGEDPPEFQTEIFVPVGNVITTRLERITAG